VTLVQTVAVKLSVISTSHAHSHLGLLIKYWERTSCKWRIAAFFWDAAHTAPTKCSSTCNSWQQNL